MATRRVVLKITVRDTRDTLISYVKLLYSFISPAVSRRRDTSEIVCAIMTRPIAESPLRSVAQYPRSNVSFYPAFSAVRRGAKFHVEFLYLIIALIK